MVEKTSTPPVVRFGPFTLDGRSGELRNGPTRLKVPDQSIAILQALLEQPGELVTREALRDRLWGPDTFVDFEAGLNAAVRRLREALNDSADTPRYVETLPRRGYRFVAPVEGALAAVHPQDSTRTELAGATPVGLRRPWVAALAFAVIGAAIWAAVGRNNPASVVPSPVPITSFPGLEVDPAISPRGSLVAFAWEGERAENFDIYVRSIDGSTQLRLTTDPAADHSPAWSPDGQRIAFVRIVDGQRVVMVMPAFGGSEERLFDAGPEHLGWRNLWSYDLSWTPDGNHLAFGERDVSANTSAIHLYSLASGQKRQLTHPPANFGDIHPVVSPDLRYVAYVRLNLAAFGGNVFRQALDQLRGKGDPVQLTFDNTAISLDWAQDSGSIIYDSYDEGLPRGLWRIAVSGGIPQPVLPNVRASRPSMARTGTGVVYQTVALDSNIWELQIPTSPNPDHPADAPLRVIESTFHDLDPHISPDGARIVFVSTRSGTRQLWIANRDGSDQKQLTTFDGRTGSPRWSTDGKRIAFDAAIQNGAWNLHVVSADGGPSLPLTADTFNNARPSWSPGDRWIYFGSDRTREWQIWRMPSAGGGKPAQITFKGGLTPIVAADGRVYYTKQYVPGIWEVPAEGGTEVETIKQRDSRTSSVGGFDVADSGIFMIDKSTNPFTVEMFSFVSRQLVPVARLPGARSVANVAVSRDGRLIVYVQYESRQGDIEMLRELR